MKHFRRHHHRDGPAWPVPGGAVCGRGQDSRHRGLDLVADAALTCIRSNLHSALESDRYVVGEKSPFHQ